MWTTIIQASFMLLERILKMIDAKDARLKSFYEAWDAYNKRNPHQTSKRLQEQAARIEAELAKRK